MLPPASRGGVIASLCRRPRRDLPSAECPWPAGTPGNRLPGALRGPRPASTRPAHGTRRRARPLVGQHELPVLVGMGAASLLAHGQQPLTLPGGPRVTQQQPGVGPRQHAHRGLGILLAKDGRYRGDPPGLEDMELAGQHHSHLGAGGPADEAGDPVDDRDSGRVLRDQARHHRQVVVHAELGRPDRRDPQQARLHPASQVQADRAHVADHLIRRFLEQDQQGPLAPRARRIDQVRSQRGLPGARRPADQDGRPPEQAAGQHRVQPRHAGGDPLAGRAIVERNRRDRRHQKATVRDQERVLAGPVRRPAVLDHLQPPRGNLIPGAVVQRDHAVAHVLLNAVPGQRAVLAALAGHDRGDGPVLQPAEQPHQLSPHDRLGTEHAEQRFDRIEDNPPGPDALDRVVQQQEQRLEVELPRPDNLRRLGPERIDDQQPVPLQPVKIKAQRGDVGGDLLD